jgi:hypothetical protein
MRALTSLCPLLLAAVAGMVLGSGAQGAPARLAPEPLPGSGSSLTWDAPQFLQADAKGRVFLLRGDDLSVYPVSRGGELGEPVRLEGPRPFEGHGRHAAMSPTGEWLVLRNSGSRPALLRGGRAELLAPVERLVEAAGFLGGDPVVSVLPFGGFQSARDREKPAYLLLHQGGRWSPLLAESIPGREGDDEVMSAILARTGSLLGDADGKLWVAQHYLYRLRRFSPAGRPLVEVQVGEGEPREAADPARARAQLLREAVRDGLREERRSEARAVTAEEVVRAFTRGRDGALYLLVKADQGFVLDRFDPSRAVVERIPLALEAAGKIRSMAAGKDALYLAAQRGNGGRFRISWEALDTAPWRQVETAEVRRPR